MPESQIEHLEPEYSRKDFYLRDVKERLNTPFSLVKEKSDGGKHQEYQLDGFTLQADFTDFKLADRPKLSFRQLLKLPSEMIEKARERVMVAQLVRNFSPEALQAATFLEDLLLQREGVETFQLKTVLPADARVILIPTRFIDPEKLDINLLGGADPEHNKIFLPGEINNLGTIMRLLHETGHLALCEKKSPEEKKELITLQRKVIKVGVFGGSLTLAEANSYIKEERDAWGWALAKIRPFLKSQQKEDILAYMHRDVLKTNSDMLRILTDPSFKGYLKARLEEAFTTY